MSASSEAVKKWRKSSKERMIEAMGGRCSACGYSRCSDALQFHHLDPAKKDFTIGQVRANPTSWTAIVDELRKCVMLCSRCHTEVHAGIREPQSNWPKFNETYATYERSNARLYEPCPVCRQAKPITLVTCSRSCAAKQSGKVKWDTIDVVAFCEGLSYEEAGRRLGCTGAAVKKRLLKVLASK